MHTFDWHAPEHKRDEEDPNGVYIHHNGDYSGEAIINIPTAMCTVDLDETAEKLYPGVGVQRYEIKLPAKLLAEFSRAATISEAISALEDME